MRLIIFMILSVGYLLLSGCARDNAVAMNYYNPNHNEKVISSSVVITKKMINDIKKRRTKYTKKKR